MLLVLMPDEVALVEIILNMPENYCQKQIDKLDFVVKRALHH